MDKKFPKITFDIFGFALANKCVVGIWIDDYVFSEYLIRVRLMKGGKSINLAVVYMDIYESDEAFNLYLATKINEAMKQLDESLEEEHG